MSENKVKMHSLKKYYKLTDEKLLELFDEHSIKLKSYAKKIYGDNFKLSEENKKELVLDMLLMTLESCDCKAEIPSKMGIESKLDENVHIREVLEEKLGIKKDYKIQGLIGDHGIYQSTDFMLDDIAGIDELDITPEEFRAISDKYFTRISDMIQQNNLLKMQIKYESDNLSEDISIESLKENFFEFLNGNRELNLKNKVYVKEMMNLVRSYDKYSLLNASKQVEDELSSGLYELVRYPNSYFSNEERTCLDKITSIWKSEDFRNFKNLKLLRKRYNDILSGNECSRKDIKKCVQKIDKILSNGILTMKNASKVKNEMATLYANFEYENRNDIISHLVNPQKSTRVSKKEDIPENMLIHVYDPESSKLFENVFATLIVDRYKRAIGEEPNVAEEVGFYKYLDQGINEAVKKDLNRFKDKIDINYIKDAANELKPNITFKFKDEDILFRKEVLQTQEHQIACRLSVPDEIKDIGEECRGLSFAVGINGDKLRAEDILLCSDKNANSNVGIDNIPVEDKFVELSKTRKELEAVRTRTEVLLKRENLEAGYLLIIKSRDLDEDEIMLEENEINKANKLGIKIIEIDIREIEKNENIQDYFRQELGKQCEISDEIVKNELSRNDELPVNEDKENVSFQKD